MSRKRKRNKIVEIGTGPATVKIYTSDRKNGNKEHTLAWREGGRRRRRSFACMDEARLVAQQINVKLINGQEIGNEVTRRDLELLRYCEQLADKFGVSMTVAMEEWAHARELAGTTPLSEAIRYHKANTVDALPERSTLQVGQEFVVSRKARGVSESYIDRTRDYVTRFSNQVKGSIAEVGVDDINRFLRSQTTLSPITKNAYRTCLVTMFRFAKRQGYLHPDRPTAPECTETFKVPETEIGIFTPEEMEKMLLIAHARILPVLAIGGFAGIRTAEICRLDWEDVKWDRGHIEIAGRKAKTAARRIVPLTDNLKAWLAPWRHESGPIVPIKSPSHSLCNVATKAEIPGGWRQNALRHSFISYRVAETGDVPRTALEAGNSPKMIFRHYREVVDEQTAGEWFAIMPPDGWEPEDLPWPVRERLRRIASRTNGHGDAPCVDSANGATP